MKKRKIKINKKVLALIAVPVVALGVTGAVVAMRPEKELVQQAASATPTQQHQASVELAESAATDTVEQEQSAAVGAPAPTTDQQTTEPSPTVQTITQCIVNDSITETETGGSAKVTVYTIEHYSDGSTKVYSPYTGSYPVPPGPPAFCPNNQAPSP